MTLLLAQRNLKYDDVAIKVLNLDEMVCDSDQDQQLQYLLPKTPHQVHMQVLECRLRGYIIQRLTLNINANGNLTI